MTKKGKNKKGLGAFGKWLRRVIFVVALIVFLGAATFLASTTPAVNTLLGGWPSKLVLGVENRLFVKHESVGKKVVKTSTIPAAAYDYQQHLIDLSSAKDGDSLGTIQTPGGFTNNIVKSTNYSSVSLLTATNLSALYSSAGKLGEGSSFIYAHDYNTRILSWGFTYLGQPNIYGDSYIDKKMGLINSPMIGNNVLYTSADGQTTETFVITDVVFADQANGMILDADGNDIPNTSVAEGYNPWNASQKAAEGQKNGFNVVQTCAFPGNIKITNSKFNELDPFGEYEYRKVEYICRLQTLTYTLPNKQTVTESFKVAGAKTDMPAAGQLVPIGYEVK